MNDRRRNLFILLLVAGLLAGSIAVILTQPTKLGLDLKGGVSLTFQAKPTKQSKVTSDAINRALDVMRKRVDNLGVSEPEIQRSGSDQIDVSLPDVKNADEARRQVGTTAQLLFYDWEASVVGPDCKPNPSDPNVTGGASAGAETLGLSQFDAITRVATKCKATNTGKERAGTKYYLVDKKAKKVLAGPDESRADLQREAENKRVKFDPAAVVAVPQGFSVVLADQPVLDGNQIKNPEQNFDNGPGESGQPNVTFDFTGQGASIWKKFTRKLAQRGQAQSLGAGANASNQHFAIELDSVPQIDWSQYPDGIDPSGGSRISGGFTITSAQTLANLLKTGALPIKLEAISASQVSATLGKQALNQGLIAGIAGFIVVALFLLTFYRVLGVIAVGALLVYSAYFFALIKLIPITLTLPGIAGLILTIGVAADANIVIFERVKE